METEGKKDATAVPLQSATHGTVLFAETPNSDMVIGVVTTSEEPSSLALLAVGIAGMAERRRRRQNMIAQNMVAQDMNNQK